jgi:hypothetical protein
MPISKEQYENGWDNIKVAVYNFINENIGQAFEGEEVAYRLYGSGGRGIVTIDKNKLDRAKASLVELYHEKRVDRKKIEGVFRYTSVMKRKREKT